jgi:hypothetical protein
VAGPSLMGAAAAYRKSARDAFLRKNGTDSMHWEESDRRASDYGKVSRINQTRTAPGRKPGPHTPALCRRLVRQPQQITPKTLPLNPNVPRKPRVWLHGHVGSNRELHEVVSAKP